MSKVTVRYLLDNDFKLKNYPPDGNCYVRHYHCSYFLQVSEDLSEFTEYADGYIEDLTEQQFIDTINEHNKAINQ